MMSSLISKEILYRVLVFPSLLHEDCLVSVHKVQGLEGPNKQNPIARRIPSEPRFMFCLMSRVRGDKVCRRG